MPKATWLVFSGVEYKVGADWKQYGKPAYRGFGMCDYPEETVLSRRSERAPGGSKLYSPILGVYNK